MTKTANNKLLELIEHNSKYIPGGVSSINRLIDPPIAFVKAEGAYLWDIDDRRYIDYHAGFAPYFLGHNFLPINQAAIDVLHTGESLFGAGSSVLEGKLAELICENISVVEKMTLLNTGSEATSLAVKLSRAVTGRDHFISIQGSYNGNHDELACNVFNSIEEIGPRVSPGEYPLRPIGAGTTVEKAHLVHAINFNDLESVRYACQRYPIAALILEPVLQNIGVVKPQEGYLAGLRKLADEFGFILIFDEVKTGFRHALGGYSTLSGVTPDLVVYGKAIANGFPLAVLGGKAKYMDYILHKDPRKRPFVAGTYNGHPVAVAAAIRTVEYLIEHEKDVYAKTADLGRRMKDGILRIFESHGVTASVSQQGSAFSYYLMPDSPKDLHDIIEHHDFKRDEELRKSLIRKGVFFVPIATKQCSISYSHSVEDIEFTLEKFDEAVGEVWGN